MNKVRQNLEGWVLPSGQWNEAVEGGGFEQFKTALGNALSQEVGASDRTEMLPFSYDPGDKTTRFPPEFRFHPDTGVELERVNAIRPSSVWLPPSGDMVSSKTDSGLRGLPQTRLPLQLTRTDERQHTDHAEHRMSTPGSGRFEFFVCPCATRSPELLALNTERGLLYVWLPMLGEWRQLSHVRNGVLAECQILGGQGWRAELTLNSEGISQLFIPTDEGLACLHVDAAALVFDVTYSGKGAAVGAPVRWANRIWTPIQRQGVALEIIGCNESGQVVDTLQVLGAGTLQMLRNMQLPLADARRALWLCDEGRLQLKLKVDGGVEAEFVNWPSRLAPRFQFGAPYHANDGDLWQLCWSTADNEAHYSYLNLTSRHGESEAADRPLMSVGDASYRYVQRINGLPWELPEQGVDGADTEHFIPMLEAPESRAVLGVRVKGTGGLSGMLESQEKMTAVLVCDYHGAPVAFESIGVRAPWRLRWFVYDNKLWAFHVDLPKLMGWELQS